MGHKSLAETTATIGVVDNDIFNPSLASCGAEIDAYGEHAHYRVATMKQEKIAMRICNQFAIIILSKYYVTRSELP